MNAIAALLRRVARRRSSATFAALIALLAIPVTACQAVGAPPPPEIPGAPTVIVSLTEMRFSPAEIHLPAGAVNIAVKNDGLKKHDLTIADANLKLVVEPGQTVTAGLRDLSKGRHEVICTQLGHEQEGMKGVVIVD